MTQRNIIFIKIYEVLIQVIFYILRVALLCILCVVKNGVILAFVDDIIPSFSLYIPLASLFSLSSSLLNMRQDTIYKSGELKNLLHKTLN